MKTPNISIILIILGITIVFLSCEKLEIVRTMDTKTDSISINSTVVVAYGTLLDIGDSKIIQHGHCWSTTPGPTTDNFKSELGPISERDTFSSQLNKIIPGIEHYIRSYIYDGTNYVYGNAHSFTLSSENIDFITEKIKIDETTVNINSNVNNIGSINFDDHGHCWSQIDPPTLDDNITSFGQIDTNQSFTSNINNLNLGRYYIRGYMISENGVIYSNTTVFDSEISVITGSTTLTISETDTVFTAYGTIISLGIEPIRDHGFIWSPIDSDPLISPDEDDKFTIRNSLGSADKLVPFSSEINDLIDSSTYYIRSYASDGINVFYGKVKSFTTPSSSPNK